MDSIRLQPQRWPRSTRDSVVMSELHPTRHFVQQNIVRGMVRAHRFFSLYRREDGIENAHSPPHSKPLSHPPEAEPCPNRMFTLRLRCTWLKHRPDRKTYSMPILSQRWKERKPGQIGNKNSSYIKMRVLRYPKMEIKVTLGY